MFLNKLEGYSHQDLMPAALCNLIQLKYQPQISSSCTAIKQYLFAPSNTNELTASTFEITQLLFHKLEDEIKHLFLTESGIVFPYIKKKHYGKKKLYINLIDENVINRIRNKQQKIIKLTQNIRQLLNNYIVKPWWSKEWMECENELFLLEKYIFQWIHIEQNLLYPKVSYLNNKKFNNHRHHHFN